MKLTLGFAAGLAGCAAAAQQAAEVYIFPTDADATSTPPSVSPSLARLVLLQRLAPAGKGPSSADIPEGVDVDTVVELMNKYGGEGVPLFGEHSVSPSQLVIMLEGMTGDQIRELGEGLKTKPAFTITDPPGGSAHDKLVKNDFYNVGITNEHKCSLMEVTNPFEERCWSGRSTVARYNVKKQPDVLSDLARQAESLAKLARSGEMETTFVLLPASGEAKQWSDNSHELRRRQFPAEQIISAHENPSESAAPSSPSDADTIFYASTKSIPSCFQSEDSCATSTGNCSGHGSCRNKYANPDGSESKDACYVCHCLSTVSESGSLTHWAGPTCAKKDISVAFWLFFGFTVVMVGVLSMSIALLFNVGEEKLPGVIGAGVSKSK